MRFVIKTAFLKESTLQLFFFAFACGAIALSGAEKIAFELFESPFLDPKRLVFPFGLLLIAWISAYFRATRLAVIGMTSMFWGFVLWHALSLIGVLNVQCDCFPVTKMPQVLVVAFDIFIVLVGLRILGRWQDFTRPEKMTANSFFVLSVVCVFTVAWYHRDAVEFDESIVGVEMREVSRELSREVSRAGWLVYDVEVEIENFSSRPLLVNLEPTCTCQKVSESDLRLAALDKVKVGLEHAVKQDVSKRDTSLSLNVAISRSSFNPKEKYRLPVKVRNE